MWQNTEKEQREEITMEKEILYVRDLVQMFGVTRQAVDVWCRKGWIKYNQLGSGRRWFVFLYHAARFLRSSHSSLP